VSVAARPRSSFRLVGRSFLAFVLTPEPPLENWIVEFSGWAGRSEGIFSQKPVVLDLSRFSPSRAEVAELTARLQEQHVRIIAVEGVDPAWVGPGLAPLPGGNGIARVVELQDKAPGPQPSNGSAPGPRASSMVLESPVRSGQSVVFPEGDVTIIGSVASGAEVIAGGSIHIYGTLRGRAVAGSRGNREARIFCRRLDAELLAIAGLYRAAETLEPQLRNRPVQAWLSGKAIMVDAQA